MSIARSLSRSRLLASSRRLKLSIPRRFIASSSVHNGPDPFPLPLSNPDLAAAASRVPIPHASELNSSHLPKPLDRSHEDAETTRARLVYQSRKRGTLETDLLLSTFARDELPTMSMEEMREFDQVRASSSRRPGFGIEGQLLDEPDWDIYYWSIKKREPPERWAGTPLLEK